MATPSSRGPNAVGSNAVDPASDLDLLDRAQSTVDVDQVLDFGPWWYAPLLATMIGGLTLFGQATSRWLSIVAGLAAVTAGVVLSVHDYRRRKVRLRRSMRSAVFIGLIVVITWLLIAAWGTAISSLGAERFVPGPAVAAWALTTIALLGVRRGFESIRRRRPPLR
jgi:hypothetical protein